MDSIIQYSLLVTSLILNGIAGIKSHQIAESRIKYPYMPLPDIIHDNLPRINHHIPDYILAVVIGSTIIKGLISSNFQTELQLGLNPLICSLFLRSATVIVTIIPTCARKPNHPNIYQKICTSTHDLIFSGHTLLFIFFGKLIEENFHRGCEVIEKHPFFEGFDWEALKAHTHPTPTMPNLSDEAVSLRFEITYPIPERIRR